MHRERLGIWDHEPDEETSEHEGLSWCGYIEIPDGHPWVGAHIDDPDAHVHGGITWSRATLPSRSPLRPTPARTTAWVIGFDCAHYGDLTPGFPNGGTYRDIGYARAEVRSLARQARAAGGYRP
jgi:hypothetical protein